MHAQRQSLRALLRGGAALLSVLPVLGAAALAAPPAGLNDNATTTPIKHVIVIVGENRSFDHMFATYVSPHGDHVLNILSEGVIKADGTPGPNFHKARQFQATDTTTYSPGPTITGAYATLPPPSTGGASTAQSYSAPPFPPLGAPFSAPFYTVGNLLAYIDPGLAVSGGASAVANLTLLTTGATGLPKNSVDTRIANAANLPSGPFPMGPGANYDQYGTDLVHRFYQMFQQMDCRASYATVTNPSGCRADLFPWVATTVGEGSNGAAQPSPFTNLTTGQGGISMGFFNVAQGELPYLTSLAQKYTLLDNYHQPAKGGTGLDSLYLGYADDIWYSDGAGAPAVPPSNQIENPDPQAGTNNWYTQDGYSGGTYSNCSDNTQPGVGAINAYLLGVGVSPHCETGHYYLLNNYNPGYQGDGTVLPRQYVPFTIPPSSVPSIADRLIDAKVSWAYYGEGWNTFVANPTSPLDIYCNICNPFLYETSIMTGTDASTGVPYRQQNLADLPNFYADLAAGHLPAVSYVKPSGINDGHPQTSKVSIFEAFVKNIVDAVESDPQRARDTAIMITVDEGGGFWDSGYVQSVDFFGDGPRIPMIIVSPYTTGGRVSHAYSDHASVPKFIEANWSLPTITARSRDNLPNPITAPQHPYVPINGPAISDLMAAFHFPVKHGAPK